MSFKRVKVVMLPTNEKSNLRKYPTGKLFFTDLGDFHEKCINQYLYILSDEEIKEGDWVYSVLYGIGHVEKDYGNSLRPLTVKFDNSEVRQSYHRNGFYDNLDVSAHNCKKIIATTDKSLVNSNCCIAKEGLTKMNEGCRDRNRCLIPQPSTSFIEKFVEEYNKGNVITEVMVEYEENYDLKYNFNGIDYTESVKINPKDNTITIRKTKDSWNREEVVELMAKAFYTDCRVWRNRYQDWEEVDFDKWIEENL